MDQQPKPTETQQLDSPSPSEAAVVPDPTRICWTQLLREKTPSVGEQRPPLQRSRIDFSIEKLFK